VVRSELGLMMREMVGAVVKQSSFGTFSSIDFENGLADLESLALTLTYRISHNVSFLRDLTFTHTLYLRYHCGEVVELSER